MAKLGPLPDVQNVCKIRFLGKTPGGNNWANVLHAKFTGTASQTTLNAIAAALRPFWTGDLAPFMVTSCTLTTVEVTDLSSRSGNQGIDTVGGNGSVSAAPGPDQVAACLSFKISQRYRGGHPRMYLPGIPPGNVTAANKWNSGVQAGMTAAGRAFLGHVNALTIGSTTWQLCAVSYYHKVGGLEAYKTPPDVYVINDVVCHGRIDTMRRRLGKETA